MPGGLFAGVTGEPLLLQPRCSAAGDPPGFMPLGGMYGLQRWCAGTACGWDGCGAFGSLEKFQPA